jgi:hypothetical protein
MRKRKSKLALVGLLIAIALIVFIPWGKKIPIGNGNYAHVRPASFVGSCFSEANATISFRPQSGQAGEIVLWQSLFDGPAMLIGSTNTNVLFCLYDYDTAMCLFRIDVSKPFEPVPQDGAIYHILFTSSWEIKEGAEADWQEFLQYLQRASPEDFKRHLLPSSFRFRRSGSPQNILHYLTYQGIRPSH